MISRLRTMILTSPPGTSPSRNLEHREPVQDRLRTILRDGASTYRDPEHRELFLSALRLTVGETV